MAVRHVALVLAALALACTRDPADHEAAKPTVPGLETAVAATAPIRDVVRMPGTVAPDGLTPEARDARNDLAAAEARLRLATQQVARLQALAQAVAPKKDLDAALAEEASARSAAERARQVVASLGGRPDAAGTPPATAWVVARVPQEAVGLVAAGADARFMSDTTPRETFEGTVDGAPSYVDQTSRTAPVRVRVTDPQHRLLPGMTGSVAIEVGTPHEGVTVPEAAVVYDDRRALVFVDDGHGGYSATQVTLGVIRDGVAEITSGLAAGARVATTGAASLLSAAALAAGGGD